MVSQPTHSSNRILRPVKGWFILLTLLLALFLNMLPVIGRLPAYPDWLALILTFWCVREPRKLGMGTAFVLGLVMDVVNAGVIGQHALAYVPLAYAATSLSRRILWFPLLKQALQILPLLFLADTLMLLVRMLAGAEFPGLEYFTGPLVATVLWYPLTFLLLLPQYQPTEKDENRPI